MSWFSRTWTSLQRMPTSDEKCGCRIADVKIVVRVRVCDVY